MIIYDNIIYSLQKSGGISVYWKILEDLIQINNRLVYKGREKNIFYTKRKNEIFVNSNLLFERYKNQKFKEDCIEPFIFHSSYYRYCKNKNAINITTVHDFTYELFRKDLKSNLHKIQKKNAVMHSDGVICISENTKRDLYKYYPNYKGQVRVIYHGYDNKTFNYRNNNQKTKNVLFVGSRANYKGFDFTINLISKLPSLRLKIIGGGTLSETEKRKLDTLLPQRYEYLGFVSNENLANLYNESFALFYPSEYEGFGFPIIEAQACGCPVICQAKSCIPEVSGDKCIYVDSSDFNKSILEIKKLENMEFYKNLQNEGLQNVKRFSWDKCIQETQDFYNDLYNRHSNKY